MEPTIYGNQNHEINVTIRIEATGRIEGDIVMTTGMPSIGKGRDHARGTETGGTSDDTMSIRDHGHGRNGGGPEVESEDEMMITLTDGGRTTIDCAAETEIGENEAAVDLVRHMLDGGVAMIDGRLHRGNEY
jgi:hypothetical protein